jgi:dTDP-glucose pyrophosphorylase
MSVTTHAKRTDMLRLELSETIAQAASELQSAGGDVALVLDNDRYAGIVRQRELAEVLSHAPERGHEQLYSLGALPAPHVHRDSSPLSIRRILQESELQYLPFVDGRGHVTRLVSRDEALNLGLFDNPVMIMAGGFGVRLRPLTSSTPKPLLQLVDGCMLDWILDHLIDCGFHRFYVAVHYLKDQIQEHLGDGSRRGVAIEYLVEETPRGTAGSLRALMGQEDLPILVTNGDVITNQNIGEVLAFHRRQAAQLTVVCKEEGVDISYGVVECDAKGEFASISEKPRLSFLINTGIYVVEPSVLRLVPDQRYFMTDLINTLRYAGGRVSVFRTREYWRDVGTMECYAQVIKDIHSGLVRSYPSPCLQANQALHAQGNGNGS